MRVSSVIPTFYRPGDLSELFESFLRQTVKPMEIIVVDDTPTAEIKVVCEEWGVKFRSVDINLFYKKNLRGRSLTIARNVGVEMAQGDIILFLDSDVILYSRYIEKILEVFEKYPNALGVQGWMVNYEKSKFYYGWQTVKKLFFLTYNSKNSCKFRQCPTILTNTINCEWLSGFNMALRHQVFEEFSFDENLENYSYMEDYLFSYPIFKKYPNGLFITPYAKCIHKASESGRMESERLKSHMRQSRKYVLTRLFGLRGLLLYCWQDIGILIFELTREILSLAKKRNKL